MAQTACGVHRLPLLSRHPRNHTKGIRPVDAPKDFTPDEVDHILALMRVIEAARAAKRRQALRGTDRPVLYTNSTDATDLVPQILEVLVNAPSLYQQHGGVIVRHRDEGKGKIEVVGEK